MLKFGSCSLSQKLIKQRFDWWCKYGVKAVVSGRWCCWVQQSLRPAIDDGDFHRGTAEAGENDSVRRCRTTGVMYYGYRQKSTSMQILKLFPQFIINFSPCSRCLRILLFPCCTPSCRASLSNCTSKSLRKFKSSHHSLCRDAQSQIRCQHSIQQVSGGAGVVSCFICLSLPGPAISIDPFTC